MRDASNGLDCIGIRLPNVDAELTPEAGRCMCITMQSHARAKEFIFESGRELDQALYRHHFEDGSTDDVCKALSQYQNSDGGFGHGLEADIRLPGSSVIATTIALQILTDAQIPRDHPMASSALSFLVDAYDHEQDNWPLVPADVESSPHAPWWRHDPDWAAKGEFLPNPGAEILRYPIEYPSKASTAFINHVNDRAIDHLFTNAEFLDMHDFLCYIRLMECPGLDPSLRDQILPHMLEAAFRLVTVERDGWEEYGLQPVAVAQRLDTDLARFFGSDLMSSIAHHVDQQGEEGAWAPNWSWGGSYADVWDQVEVQIKSELTLKTLVKFARYRLLERL